MEAEWVSDRVAKICKSCSGKFTALRRRHHCRRCGHIFCKKCSTARVELPEYCSPVGTIENKNKSKLRVCDPCFSSLSGTRLSVKAAAPVTKAARHSQKLDDIGKFMEDPFADGIPPTAEQSGGCSESVEAGTAGDDGRGTGDSFDSARTRGSFPSTSSGASLGSTASLLDDITLEEASPKQVPASKKKRLNKIRQLSKELLLKQKQHTDQISKELNVSISELKRKLHKIDAQVETSAAAAASQNEPANDKTLTDRLEKRTKLLGDLRRLEVEAQFPECMRWMLRVQTEPNLYFGIRDIDLDTVTAKFKLHAGKSICKIHVTELEAILSAYEMKICGSTNKAKMLGNLLAPSRVDLKLSGEWLLPLRYGKTKRGAPSWSVLRESAMFKIKVAKSVGGSATLKLPGKLLQWLANALLPALISNAIREAMPDALGALFMEESNCVEVEGSISLKSDTKPSVWQAKLHKRRPESAIARSILGITLEEAELLYKTLRNDYGKAVSFGQTVSMRGLHKFRLRYASFGVQEMSPLLDALEGATKPESNGYGWLSEILNKVDALANKSEVVEVSLVNVNVSFDLYSFVHTFWSIQLQAMKAACEEHTKRKTNRTAKKGLALSKMHSSENDAALKAFNDFEIAKAAASFTYTLVDILISVVEHIGVNTKLLVHGGSDGYALLSLDDLDIVCRLPQLCEVLFPANVIELMEMAMLCSKGPGKEEYKFSYYPIIDGNRTESAIDLVLGTTVVEFSGGLITGKSKRLCIQVLVDMLNLALKETEDSDDGSSTTGAASNAGKREIMSAEKLVPMIENRDVKSLLQILLPYILDDDHEFLVEIHHLSIAFSRKTGADGICRPIVSLGTKREHLGDSPDVRLKLRFGLAQVLSDFVI